MEPMTEWTERLVDKTTGPITKTSKWYWVWLGFLVAVLGWGLYAYSLQLRDGLVRTAMRDRPSWGLYIASFVFFIGISHAGTLISAILRVSNASWRAPVTRMAEIITAVALVVGALFVIIDMGRPDRILNVVTHGRWQSPILWDALAVTTYLTASILYLYTPMIPDLALLRDRLKGKVGRLRAWFYRTASLDWSGKPEQRRAQRRGITVLMIIIIPIAVSVHTVVSWIFAMTLRTPWNTTLFGVLFVAGAIFSGVATLLIIMTILRRLYHWEEYITEKHYKNLGFFLAAFSGIMIYLNVTEYMVTGYKLESGEGFSINQLFSGHFSSVFWFYVIFGFFVPMLIMIFPKTRTIPGIVVAAILIDVAMFFERYLIVVAGLRVPLMPYDPRNYFPSWVEWSIFAGGVALFALLVTVAMKVLPMQAVGEMVEEHEQHLANELGVRLVEENGIDVAIAPAAISAEGSAL